MLEHRKGKFTILKLKSSLLSYTAVEYFPFTIVMRMSKYDSVVDDSEVFLSLSSTGYMSSIAEWKNLLFNANKSSIYLMVLQKLLARNKFVLIKFLIYLYC